MTGWVANTVSVSPVAEGWVVKDSDETAPGLIVTDCVALRVAPFTNPESVTDPEVTAVKLAV